MKAEASLENEKMDAEAVASPDEDNTVYATGFNLFAIILALGMSFFLVALDMTIVGTAIPKMTDVSNSHFFSSQPPRVCHRRRRCSVLTSCSY